MKWTNHITLLLAAIIALLVLSGCSGIPSGDSGLVIGDAYRLESGKTLAHDLTVVGGNVTLEKDSIVNGSLAVIGGNVSVDGTIQGDMSVIGGYVSLNDSAVVTGQLNSLGGEVHRSSQAKVEGKVTQNARPNPITTISSPAMQVSLDPITAPLMAIFQALAMAALAVVVNLFAATYMERAGRTALAAPVASGGVGCLTILVLLIMAITIILLPISLLGFLVVGVAALFGWLALGLILGRQIAVWLKQPWTDPVNAGVGTLVLSLLASTISLIPCIGWTAYALAGLVALGAAVLSRFGTQLYPSPYAPAPMPRPGPYAPPPPPSAPSGGSRVYGPESDLPRQGPPTGTGESL